MSRGPLTVRDTACLPGDSVVHVQLSSGALALGLREPGADRARVTATSSRVPAACGQVSRASSGYQSCTMASFVDGAEMFVGVRELPIRRLARTTRRSERHDDRQL